MSVAERWLTSSVAWTTLSPALFCLRAREVAFTTPLLSVISFFLQYAHLVSVVSSLTASITAVSRRLIAGGTGIAPMCQLLRSAFYHNRSDVDIRLLYSAARPNQFAFLDLLRHKTETHPNFRMALTVDAVPEGAAWDEVRESGRGRIHAGGGGAGVVYSVGHVLDGCAAPTGVLPDGCAATRHAVSSFFICSPC